jgi:hypothetical protein
MKDIVLAHPAIHNDFLTRFSKGEVSDSEFDAYHRELESTHEYAMEEVSDMAGKDPASEKSFESGIREVLDLLHGFWVGLAEN